MMEEQLHLVLEEILTKSQIHHVVTQFLGNGHAWNLVRSEVKRMDGMPGYLGDHLKAVLHINVEGEENKLHLFIKRMPVYNKPKTKFIDSNNFFKREVLMYTILEQICEGDWFVKPYIYTDSILVMPDLTVEGFSTRPCLQVLDSDHIFLTTTSVAQFHAAFFNYVTKKSLDSKQPCRFYQEYGPILAEPTFCDSPFLRACSKLSANLIKHLSTKCYRNLENLEPKLTQLYLEACGSLREYTDTVNVLLHRDLWVNNIMYKYENGVPIRCVLVDYQCLRYGPPVFDLMMFIYLTTNRRYRQEREKDIFDYYYSTFIKSLNDDTKKVVDDLGYDKDNFLSWCEKGRMFGMFGAIAIQPFTFMDPEFAVKTLHDPATFDKYFYEDRTEPVVAHARDCEGYKYRNLEVTEEFVETYVLREI